MRRYDVENFMERRRLPLEIRKYMTYYLSSEVILISIVVHCLTFALASRVVPASHVTLYNTSTRS